MEKATLPIKRKFNLFIITVLASFLSFAQQYIVTGFYNSDAFQDISTTGTALNLNDDDEVNITSSFPIFLGNNQSTQLLVGNNGGILFDTTIGEVMGTGAHDLTTSSPMIAPLWADLDDGSGNVYWQDFGNLIIIQWDRPHYSNSSSNGVFQVKIWDTRKIYFIYKDVDFGNVNFNEGADATVGIVTSQEIVQFSKNTASVYANYVIQFDPVSTTNIPDDNFEAYLESHNANGDAVALGAADSMGNGVLNDNLVYTSRIENVTSLDVNGEGLPDSEKISDLTGIEDFTAIISLKCGSNLLTTIDVSNNTNLSTLWISLNQIDTIDVSSNIHLGNFICHSNNLSVLDLTNNPIHLLRCENNQLTSIDFSNLGNLNYFSCSGNQLTDLDLHDQNTLNYFNCYNNNLSYLNVRNGNNNNLSNFSSEGNPDLHCIYVDDVAWSTTNWTNIDDTSNFVTNDIECNATYPAPTNNDCANATNLIVDVDFEAQNIVGTNIGATETVGVETDCGSSNQSEVWFTTTVPNSGSITIETQPVDGSNFDDSVVAVYSGSCEGLTDLGCSDDNGEELGNGYFSTIELTDLTPGDILYITVYSYEEQPFGEFKIAAYDASVSGISDNEIHGLSIYPNPVKDNLRIQAVNKIDTIEIYNMLGQVVLSQTSILNNIEIDLSNLLSGNYVVKIQSNNQVGTYKLIKK